MVRIRRILLLSASNAPVDSHPRSKVVGAHTNVDMDLSTSFLVAFDRQGGGSPLRNRRLCAICSRTSPCQICTDVWYHHEQAQYLSLPHMLQLRISLEGSCIQRRGP